VGFVTSLSVGPACVAWVGEDAGIDTEGQLALLSGPDGERAAGFRPDRLRRFLLGRALVRALVRVRFPEASTWSVFSGECRRCGTRHAGVEIEGAPVLASVSYADGIVVAAVADTALTHRLGVDVEADAADQTRTDDLQRLLGASSEAVLRRWTRVEAVLKADGRGLLIDPGAVWLRRGGAWIAGEAESYVVTEVPGPAGYLVSLAWSAAAASAAEPGRATRRTAGPAGTRWFLERTR